MPSHTVLSLTKIIATIGPASAEVDLVGKLIDAGASVFRRNFGHGRLSAHQRYLKAVRRAAESRKRPIAVMETCRVPRSGLAPSSTPSPSGCARAIS